ncbi:MAG: hypothetical protein ACHP65_09845 [Legionellales bacterium]
MSLTIKNNCDADNSRCLVSSALQSGGHVLNGAKELNKAGGYKAVAPGMDCHNNTFTLGDQWFNGESQDIGTVIKAVEQATGIKLKFASQMLSSEPATISSYEIVNQEQYDVTVGKQMKFEADMDMMASVKP